MMTKAPFTWYNLFSNRLSNQFDNRLNVGIHNTTGCQTSCQTGVRTSCIVYTNIQPVVKPVWQPAVSCIQPVVKSVVQPGLTTGWTNSGCSFKTVVKSVVRPGCTTSLTNVLNEQSVRSTQLSNRLYNAVWQLVVSCKWGITNTWKNIHLTQIMYLRYFVKMKHHISYFYNALLEYYPLHEAQFET